MLRNLSLTLTALSAIVLFAPSAMAVTCELDNESIVISQSNGFVATLNNIRQVGTKMSGLAKTSTNRGDFEGSISKTGRFKVTVDWDGDSIGIYTGHVEADGTVNDGRTYDKQHPANWATWTTSQLPCE